MTTGDTSESEDRDHITVDPKHTTMRDEEDSPDEEGSTSGHDTNTKPMPYVPPPFDDTIKIDDHDNVGVVYFYDKYVKPLSMNDNIVNQHLYDVTRNWTTVEEKRSVIKITHLR